MALAMSNITPYFGGLYGRFAKCFVFGMALVITAGAIFAGGVLGPGIWFFANCLFALAVDGLVVLALFTYTEFDEYHIAKVFRFGRMIRHNFAVVKWTDVATAETQADLHNSVVYLHITKRGGQKLTFTTTAKSDGADNFAEIARHFHKSNISRYA